MEVARRPVVPPGYRFTPTPEELIRCYLNPWVTGRRFPRGVVCAADIYAADPDALTSRFRHAGHDGSWYFLCVARWKGGRRSTRMNRCVGGGGGGTWHGSSKRKPVGRDDHRQGFEYRASGNRKTPWIMEEFVTNLKEATDSDGIRVICKVYRSPRAVPPDDDEEANRLSKRPKLHEENSFERSYYATTSQSTTRQQSMMEQGMGGYCPGINGNVGVSDSEPWPSAVESVAGMDGNLLAQMGYDGPEFTASELGLGQWLDSAIICPDETTDGVKAGDDHRGYTAES